jgi:hypothetical protein
MKWSEASEAERLKARRRRHDAARRYQPKRVKLLLIAEAPPDELDSYFYFEGNDELLEPVCYVLFEESPTGDRTPYLKALRRRGIFMIELKPDDPIEDSKHAELAAWLPLRVEALEPEKIVCVGTAVYRAASPVLEQAGLPIVPLAVECASDGQEAEFARTFRQALVKAGLEKLIKPLSAAERGSK